MIADDLFAGAGGWDLAAAQLGIYARGVENMREARATRDAAGLSTIHDDVWTFRPKYRAVRGGLEPIAHGLIASPPCQTFSQAGKGSGRKALDAVLSVLPNVAAMTLPELRKAGEAFGDERTALVLTPLWFALHHDYRRLAWEQVPTVLPVWEACAVVLREHGWNVWTGNLQAEQYGVPQTRKRAFLIASLDHEVSPPTPTHSRYYSRTPEKLDPGVSKWVSMAEALGWGLSARPAPTVTGGGTETGGAEPIAKLARYTDRPDWSNATRRPADHPAPTITGDHDSAERVWVRTSMGTPKVDGRNGSHELDPFNRPAHTVTTKTGEWRILSDRDDLPEWCHNRPATTVVGSFKPEVIAAPGYRTTVSRQNAPGSVRVSVQEAGVLQSFPAGHPWQGAKGKQYLQAGNAIPPLLALAVLSVAAGVPLPNPAQ